MPASKAQQAITAERRAKALALKVAGLSYEQIAEQLSYADRASAYKDIERALAGRKKDLDTQAELTASLELERLEVMERAAWTVLRRTHTLVSQGRVIKDDSGRPMQDDGPTLDAIDRLLKIQVRRAKLLSLDAPTKTEVELTGVGQADTEFAETVNAARDKRAAARALLSQSPDTA